MDVEVYRGELEEIRQRRAAVKLPPPPEHSPTTKNGLVGLALSGGGIRSATFNLGVLQALHQRGLLPLVDYVSTVSGGGYIGSCLSRVMQTEGADLRRGFPLAVDERTTTGTIRPQEKETVLHLRDFSNYLRRGALGLLTAPALLLRGILTHLLFLVPLVALLSWGGSWAIRSWRDIPKEPSFELFAPTLEVAFACALLLLAVPVMRFRWIRGLRGFYDRIFPFALLTVLLVAAANGLIALLYCFQVTVDRKSLIDFTWTAGPLSVLPVLVAQSGIRQLTSKWASALLSWIGLAGALGILLVVYVRLGTWMLGSELDLFHRRLEYDDCWKEFWFGSVLIVTIVMSIGHVNGTSLHRYYCDRLCSAYLGAAATNDDPADRPLSSLSCERGAPYHLINTTINLQGVTDPKLRGRAADFFLLSKRFCGSERTGYADTVALEAADDDLTLASAMAISGAAASPNMGTMTMRRLVPLMVLLNVRLGYWAPNPAKVRALGTNEPSSYRSAIAEGLRLLAAKRRLAAFAVLHRAGKDPAAAGALRDLALATGECALLPAGVTASPTSVADCARDLATQYSDASLKELSDWALLLRLRALAESSVAQRARAVEMGARWATGRRKDAIRAALIGPRWEEGATAFIESDEPATLDARAAEESELVRGFARNSLALRSEATESARGFSSAVRRLAVSQALVAGDWASSLRATADMLLAQPFVEHEERGGLLVRVSAWVEKALARLDSDRRVLHRLLVRLRARLDKRLAVPRSRLTVAKWSVAGGHWYLLRELTGRLDDARNLVNLSDGGHLENLGVYELLRRRCRLIYVGDSECDPAIGCGALATVIRFARIDLGAEITIDLSQLRPGPDGRSRSHCAVGKIEYGKYGPEEQREEGTLIYIKATVTGDENAYVANYKDQHAAFPHETTADQFFSEEQFEAYRALGFHIGARLVDRDEPEWGVIPLVTEHRRRLNELAKVAERRFRPTPGLEHDFVALQNRLMDLEEAFARDGGGYIDQVFFGSVLPEPDRKHFHLCSRQLHFMENVFVTLRLYEEADREHEFNEGWIRLFEKWAESETFKRLYSHLAKFYSPSFRDFCSTVLHLSETQPSNAPAARDVPPRPPLAGAVSARSAPPLAADARPPAAPATAGGSQSDVTPDVPPHVPPPT